MMKKKNTTKRMKLSRDYNALGAILRSGGGFHSDKRMRRKSRQKLNQQAIQEQL